MNQLQPDSINLNENSFMRTLIRHLSGTLEEVVGIDDAEGFISVVGQRMGDEINALYRDKLAVKNIPGTDIAVVLVDLKKRINGDFFVIEQTDEKIVLGNRRCPFGDMVKDRPSLCMMTSNVFGSITAENTGYAKVHLAETIATGHSGCRVVVYFKNSDEASDLQGREYFDSSID